MDAYNLRIFDFGNEAGGPNGKVTEMLVLSRKRDEQIVIGQDIIVTVVEIRGDKVRLGIEAPAQVPVHRQEVYTSIHGTKPTDAVKPDASIS